MKLIDADDLKDWSEIVPLTGDGGIDINDFDEKLKSMPTVDAEPIIRCKDCKYSVDEYDDGECYCDYEKDLRYIKDWGHYCSWAEGKEE